MVSRTTQGIVPIVASLDEIHGISQDNNAITVFRMNVSGPYFVPAIHLLRGRHEDLFN
jgi:hypothetical protein